MRTQKLSFNSLTFNGQNVQKDSTGLVYGNRKSDLLLRYWVNNNDSLEVSYSTEITDPIEFTALEFSYDLMDNENFSISKRPKDMMPKPFVVTDAIIVKRNFIPENLSTKQIDSMSTVTAKSQL